MSFYSDLADIATDLLTEFGQVVTVTRKNNGVFDPATGITASAADTTFTGNAAIFDYIQSQIDGQNIEQGDKRALIDSANIPLISDIVTTTDGDFNIVSVNKTGPNGEAVIYELQLRP